MTESRRMLLRVFANYCGLVCNLAVGIILVKVLLRTLGADGFGLIALFGSTVGIGMMLQEIVRQSLIRELGFAYHQSHDDFRRLFGASFWLMGVTVVLNVCAFAVLWWAVPRMAIPEHLVFASRLFVVSKCLHSSVMIFFTPLFNLYVITERMGWANLLQVLERVGLLGAALATFYYVKSSTPGDALVFYGFLSAVLPSSIVVVGSLALPVFLKEFRIMPTLRDLGGVRALVRSCGLNALVVTSVNMHIRADAVIMNLTQGLTGNLIFGLAVQFTSWTRRIAVGMTLGLDAVATRLSAGAAKSDMAWLLRQATRSHAAVVFPVAVMVWALCPQLIDLWVGAQMVGMEREVEMAIALVRILIVGISIRAVSDAWLRVLYGAGHIHRYALAIVVGALLNPLLAVVLVALLPEHLAYMGPSIAFSIVFVVIHGLWLARIVVRVLGLSMAELLGPLAGPACATLLAVLPAWGASWWTRSWGPSSMGLALLVFVFVYTGSAWWLVLTAGEKAGIRKRLKR